jgi:hypothetical protein
LIQFSLLIGPFSLFFNAMRELPALLRGFIKKSMLLPFGDPPQNQTDVKDKSPFSVKDNNRRSCTKTGSSTPSNHNAIKMNVDAAFYFFSRIHLGRCINHIKKTTPKIGEVLPTRGGSSSSLSTTLPQATAMALLGQKNHYEKV